MSTWANTLKVLGAEELFRKIFLNSITALCQLWNYNKNPTCRTLDDQITRGVDQITSTIKSMAIKIHELGNKIQSIQLKQDDMTSAQLKLMDQDLLLNQRICIMQQALLVQEYEKKDLFSCCRVRIFKWVAFEYFYCFQPANKKEMKFNLHLTC